MIHLLLFSGVAFAMPPKVIPQEEVQKDLIVRYTDQAKSLFEKNPHGGDPEGMRSFQFWCNNTSAHYMNRFDFPSISHYVWEFLELYERISNIPELAEQKKGIDEQYKVPFIPQLAAYKFLFSVIKSCYRETSANYVNSSNSLIEIAWQLLTPIHNVDELNSIQQMINVCEFLIQDGDPKSFLGPFLIPGITWNSLKDNPDFLKKSDFYSLTSHWIKRSGYGHEMSIEDIANLLKKIQDGFKYAEPIWLPGKSGDFFMEHSKAQWNSSPFWNGLITMKDKLQKELPTKQDIEKILEFTQKLATVILQNPSLCLDEYYRSLSLYGDLFHERLYETCKEDLFEFLKNIPLPLYKLYVYANIVGTFTGNIERQYDSRGLWYSGSSEEDRASALKLLTQLKGDFKSVAKKTVDTQSLLRVEDMPESWQPLKNVFARICYLLNKKQNDAKGGFSYVLDIRGKRLQDHLNGTNPLEGLSDNSKDFALKKMKSSMEEEKKE